MYWIKSDPDLSEMSASLSSAVDSQLEELVKELHDLGSHHSQA